MKLLTADTAPSFAAWLQEQRGGLLHNELSDALADVVAGVVSHRQSGTVVLELTVTPCLESGQVEIADAVLAKAPEGDRGERFFADPAGNLSRHDTLEDITARLRGVVHLGTS